MEYSESAAMMAANEDVQHTVGNEEDNPARLAGTARPDQFLSTGCTYSADNSGTACSS